MNPTVILWNTAVFLASVFGALIVGCTLKPKFGKRVTGLLWGAFAAGGYLISLLSYTVDLYNDLVGILGLSALICIATEVLYTESRSAKLFTAVMACLIANVVTFMFCGTTDTFLGTALGLIETTLIRWEMYCCLQASSWWSTRFSFSCITGCCAAMCRR